MSRNPDRWAPLFEGINTSTRFADLPDHSARLFYVMLQTKLDDWGRVTADARKLNALVWPMLGMTEAQTLAAIQACRKAGLLEVFDSDQGPFLVNVEHEQKAGAVGKRDHRRASKFPEPSELTPVAEDWPAPARTGPSRPVLARSGPRVRAPAQAGAPSGAVLSSAGAVLCSDSDQGGGPGGGGRSTEPPPAAKPQARAAATGPHAELIQFWERLWLETRGVAYAVERKDGVAAAAILKKPGATLEEAQRRAERLLTSADPWLAQNASLTLLSSRWNQLAFTVARGQEPKGAKGVRDYEAMVAAGQDPLASGGRT
jgi:hypothetical protein